MLVNYFEFVNISGGEFDLTAGAWAACGLIGSYVSVEMVIMTNCQLSNWLLSWQYQWILSIFL